MKLENVKFMHLRDPKEPRRVLTVAYAWEDPNEYSMHTPPVVRFSYCICNPADQFSKKVARAKAAGRLNMNSIKLGWGGLFIGGANSQWLEIQDRERHLMKELMLSLIEVGANNYRARQIARHYAKKMEVERLRKSASSLGSYGHESYDGQSPEDDTPF